MKKKFSKSKGFTLMELMVVIAIIGIMSAVGIVSLVGPKKTMSLKSAQNEVASAIKLAQSYALQGRMAGGVRPCGYGFKINSVSEYEIFSYNQATCPASFNTTGSASIEKKTLGNGVVFNSVVDGVEFSGPSANVFLSSGSSLVITLKNSAGDNKAVTINKYGLVTEN